MEVLLVLLVLLTYWFHGILGVDSSGQLDDTCPFTKPCYCTQFRIICEDTGATTITQKSKSNGPSGSNYVPSWHELRIQMPQLLGGLPHFTNMGNLRVSILTATSSNIATLPPGSFMPFVQMESLNLSSNSLTSINQGDLMGLENLRRLDLHNNQIESIDVDAFKYTTRLKQLFLSYNRLATVPSALKMASSLTHLYLRGNPIHMISDDHFTGLYRLIILDLGQLANPVYFHPGSFCGLHRLKPLGIDSESYEVYGISRLYLSNNTIGAFPSCLLTPIHFTLGYLDLSDSQLLCQQSSRSRDQQQCDSLGDLALQVSSRHFQLVPPKYQCHSGSPYDTPRCNYTLCEQTCTVSKSLSWGFNSNGMPSFRCDETIINLLIVILSLFHGFCNF